MKYSVTPTKELRDLLIDKLFENPNDIVVEDTIDYITNTQKEITKLQQENKQQKEEITRLKRVVKEYIYEHRLYGREISKLKSILTELEEWLKENIKSKPLQTTCFFEIDHKQKSISEIELNELKRVLDKIEELKEKYK